MTTPHYDDSGSVSSPPEPRWYCLNKIGMATLCTDQADAVAAALDADIAFPCGAPHRAVQMVEWVIGRNARGDYVPNARQLSALRWSPAIAEILDPCCGGRMMWFDRQNPNVVFGDMRSETITVTDRSRGNASGTRTLRIEPDALMDFRALPFADNTFRLVAFDPPHLVHAGPRSWLAAKYGKLGPDWREDLRAGFAECFRVLASSGVLVFKWNETQVPLREVLALTPEKPLFGHTSGRTGQTHWLVFMKR